MHSVLLLLCLILILVCDNASRLPDLSKKTGGQSRRPASKFVCCLLAQLFLTDPFKHDSANAVITSRPSMQELQTVFDPTTAWPDDSSTAFHRKITDKCYTPCSNLTLFVCHIIEYDFRSLDESPDAFFYNSPRFIEHVDKPAVESLIGFHDREFEEIGLRKYNSKRPPLRVLVLFEI